MSYKIKFKEQEDIKLGDVTQNDVIEVRKSYSKLHHELDKKAKPTHCILCENEFSSFCNSHSIPRFILDNIDSQSKLVTGISMHNNPLLDRYCGINKTLTFHIICESCDKTKFQDYENPNSYESTITQKMLQQIALKNYLMKYSKRLYEFESHKYQFQRITPEEAFSFAPNIIEKFLLLQKHIQVDQIDIKDLVDEIFLNKTGKLKYFLIDEIDLDYVVPLAYQGSINLISDFKGRLINDSYNLSPSYKLVNLHIAIFPLQTKSKILLFKEDGNDRLKLFYKDYKKLSLEEKLYAINYILLLYAEDIAFKPEIIDKIKINEETLKLINTTMNPESITTNELSEKEYHKLVLQNALDKFRLKTEGSILNFLANIEYI